MNPRPATTALTALLLAGCVSHRVRSEPIEIKPIHITMDINLKVQRELDEFFDFEKPTESTPDAQPQPDAKERKTP